ncbi:hypothetical protein [Romboutsia sp.]|uniref:hypothetical protein n=1 Tax=Romboutsia sp. TaxID=1965302 RepID=UPI003F329BEE
MLHRLGSIFFLLAIITSFYKIFKFINKKLVLKLHIVTGTIGALAMAIYSVIDFIKEKEFTILPVGLISILIIISGTSQVKKKCKWLHLVAVIGFAAALAFHIIY